MTFFLLLLPPDVLAAARTLEGPTVVLPRPLIPAPLIAVVGTAPRIPHPLRLTAVSPTRYADTPLTDTRTADTGSQCLPI